MATLVDDDGLGPEYARHMEVVRRLNERVATAHERVDCPTCWAPRGVKCCAMPAGYVVGPRGGGRGRELKHAHDARLRADGIALR